MKTRKEILKYLLYFALFLFYFYLEKQLGIRPFAIALFMALVYCKQNVLILIPLYIGAAMLISPSIPILIQAATPCAVVALAFFIHYKLGFKVKLIAINIYLFLSQLPLLFFSPLDIYSIINVALSLLGSQIFLYSAVIVIFAVVAKELKFKLTPEEGMAAGAIFATLGMGLISINIFWFTPYYMVLSLAVLSTLFLNKKGVFALAVTFGVGGSFASGNPSVLAISVLYGLVVSCFNKDSKYYAGIALVAVDIIYRAFFEMGTSISYLDSISPTLGVLIFFVIPNKAKEKLSYLSICFKEKQGSRSLVNRDRQMVGEKLTILSGVFYEIQDILHMENTQRAVINDVEYLTRQVCSRCCQNCIGREKCEEGLGNGATDIVVSDLVISALDNGKATILDTPPFLSSRCRKINGLISATNDIVEQYRKKEERRGHIHEGRSMISEQMGGVGNILVELKKEVEKNAIYDNALEERLLEELWANNISASEAIIYGGGEENSLSLTLVVLEGDSLKPELMGIVNDVLGIRMEITKSEAALQGRITLNFSPSPMYQVIYGERDISKVEGEVSGDKHRAIKISHSKVMLILSDGMGSGREASLNSSYAMGLIENFYKAGFDYQTIVSSVGKLLSLRGGEEFSAVDIAIIDTAKGVVDFIKMGGRESFVVYNGGVEVIECGSLPIGIIEDTLPIVERRSLQPGSFIVMVSDGVIDVIGREGLIELLSECKTNNPDSVAEMIMENLNHLNGGVNKDDASVLVGKVFCPK